MIIFRILFRTISESSDFVAFINQTQVRSIQKLKPMVTISVAPSEVTNLHFGFTYYAVRLSKAGMTVDLHCPKKTSDNSF